MKVTLFKTEIILFGMRVTFLKWKLYYLGAIYTIYYFLLSSSTFSSTFSSSFSFFSSTFSVAVIVKWPLRHRLPSPSAHTHDEVKNEIDILSSLEAPVSSTSSTLLRGPPPHGGIYVGVGVSVGGAR